VDIHSDVFCAWAAGFFDGEGCVIVETSKSPRCRHGVRTVLHIQLSQTSVACLELVQQRFGGKIVCTTHTSPNSSRWAKQYRWGVKNAYAIEFIRAIMPYSVVKKTQLELALEYPLAAPDGRKYGNTTNPIPDAVHAKRLQVSQGLRDIRASMKTKADPWEVWAAGGEYRA